MQAATGRITLTESSGQRRAVLIGEVDLAAVRRFQSEYGRGEPVDVIVADELTFIDSSGLKLLLQMHAHNPAVQLLRPPPVLRHLLEMTGTAARFGLSTGNG